MKIERAEEQKVAMIVVTQNEALEIIRSLTGQMLNGCSAGGRVEHYTADQEYVSIAVDSNGE